MQTYLTPDWCCVWPVVINVQFETRYTVCCHVSATLFENAWWTALVKEVPYITDVSRLPRVETRKSAALSCRVESWFYARCCWGEQAAEWCLLPAAVSSCSSKRTLLLAYSHSWHFIFIIIVIINALSCFYSHVWLQVLECEVVSIYVSTASLWSVFISSFL